MGHRRGAVPAPSLLLLTLALTLTLGGAARARPAPAGLEVDRARLDAIEDLTESLANALLALSVDVRRMDMPKVAGYFHDRLEAEPFPSRPGEPAHAVKWIHEHAWEVPDRRKEEPAAEPPEKEKKRRKRRGEEDREPQAVLPVLDKAQFLGEFETFLGHFSEIEDARFKVKEATFPDPIDTDGVARIYFFVVGRDLEGRREWVRGTFWIDASREGEDWRITKLRNVSLASDVAAVDLFSEISGPAGIAATFPAFGVPPNDGFVAHGGAAGDYDGDGLLDLVLTEVDGNRLFRNVGDGTFRDVSEEMLVRYAPVATGALFFDFDNDGDPDIFLAAVGRQVLLENHVDPNGVRTFRDISEQAGVAVPAVGFSAVAADVNRDGRQDVYVASYNKYGTYMPNSWSRSTNGTPNLLFINEGNGIFRESAREWGVDDSRWTYAAAFADVEGDGLQDLYLANDFGENALYMNKGTHFEDESLRRGVVDPGNGMGVAFGDVDNDGDLDLHVTNMSSTAGNRILGRLIPDARPDTHVLKKIASGNTIFTNRGNGYFENLTDKIGYLSAGWAFGGGFIDFDNDGWEDEFSANGFVSGSSMNDT